MIHTLMPAGTHNEQFYAQSGGTDIETDGTSWHPVTIPAGKKYTRLLIQCQKASPVGDVDVDMISFRVSDHATGPGVQADRLGYGEPIAFGPHETDQIVKYVWAPEGYKILCCLVG